MTPWAARRYAALGLFALVVLIGGVGGWSVLTSISGAVVSTGALEVEANRQIVQHPEGGVVADILVRDGDPVTAGEALIRLDATDLLGEQTILTTQALELRARAERLRAEALGEEVLTFSPALTAALGAVPDLTATLRDEARLFTARQETFAQTLLQIIERQSQITSVIAGRQAQITALQTQADLITEELTTQQDLLEQGLTQAAQVSALRREAARISGVLAELTASIAEAQSRISGMEIERLTLIATRTEEALAELRALQPRDSELTERLRLIDTRLTRQTLTAPMDGIVYGLNVHTERSVIGPGQEVLAIIPQNSALVIRTRIAPTEIDRVSPGQAATLRFPAFNARTTPELNATLTQISADIIEDPATGASYYTAEITPDPGEINRLTEQLLPGMPVDAFIQTTPRSPLSFLTKPLTDYFTQAFRED